MATSIVRFTTTAISALSAVALSATLLQATDVLTSTNRLAVSAASASSSSGAGGSYGTNGVIGWD